MLSQAFIDEMKQKLLEAKAHREEELKNIKPHDELGDDVDADVQEIQEDEVNRDLIANIKADLAKIDSALAKIEDGTYGTDDEGKQISEERLRVIPWADKAI